jgi:hypothetical protein
MKVKYEVAQEVIVTMCAPKEGKFPIGKTDTGCIAFIKKGAKGFFEYDSRWNCTIDEIKERFIVVTPVNITTSAVSNRDEMAEKLNQLSEIIPLSPKQEKKAKQKAQFVYMSKNEMKKEK